MNTSAKFDERDICLNCPRKRCIHESKKGATCPSIKEKRGEYRRRKKEKQNQGETS